MPAPRLTTNEYLRTPETLLPQELVYGYVRDAAAPTPRHQWAVGDIYRCFWTHLTESGAGRVWMSPIDVVLDRERGLVVQPDVIVVLNDRLPIVSDRVWGAPDLVVEVLSPQPRIGSREERIAWFAEYGVRECWIVQQLVRQVEVISFGDGMIAGRRLYTPDEEISSKVLPRLNVTPGHLLSE